MRALKDERLYWRGSTIWANVIGPRGYKVRRSTKSKRESVASAWADRFERDSADPRRAAAAKARLDDAIRELHAELKRRGRAAATLEIAEEKCGHFPRIWGPDRPLADIDAALVDRYSDQRLEEGASRLTVGHERAHLRQLLKLARRHGRYDRDVGDVVTRWETGHKPRDRWLPPWEIVALVCALKPWRAALVCYVIATGARLAEVLRAERSDVDLQRRIVRVRGSKTALSKSDVPITPITEGMLRWALAHAPGERLLFAPWGKVHADLTRACMRAGIEKCTPNDLRRTFGKLHRMAGLPPSLIAPMLRHTTDKLAQTTYADARGEELRDVVARQLGDVLDLYSDDRANQVQPRYLLAANSTNAAPPAVIETATNGLGKRRHSDDYVSHSAKMTERSAHVRADSEQRSSSDSLQNVEQGEEPPAEPPSACIRCGLIDLGNVLAALAGHEGHDICPDCGGTGKTSEACAGSSHAGPSAPPISDAMQGASGDRDLSPAEALTEPAFPLAHAVGILRGLAGARLEVGPC